jgi:flavodoxin
MTKRYDFQEGDVLIMSKILVAYFSASGVTAKLAEQLAKGIGAYLHEIQPEVPYTEADLNWMDKKSRSSVEMSDKSFRPAVANKVENMGQYQVIFIAFPIWWYVAPTIVNSFLEQYDLTGKTIIPLATSGSSGMGNTNKELAGSCPGAELKEGKRFPAKANAEELKAWAEGYGI